MFWTIRMSRSFERIDPFVEALYDLFVKEHNLDIDLMDSSVPRASAWWHVYHTKTSFDVVVASQPTPFVRLPLAQQFNAAIESLGWHADAFSAMLPRHATELVTMATDQGMTALHWAAAHFGHWLCFGQHPEKAESYAKLVSDLISMGANIHALLYERVEPFPGKRRLDEYDPFLCFLRGLDLNSKVLWKHSSMVDAVGRWGQALVAGGLNLAEYTATENAFLMSIECADLDLASSGPVPVKLLVSEDSVLVVETVDVTTICIWNSEATRIPGAWPRTSALPDTIFWTPTRLDEVDGYRWVFTGSIRLEPRDKEKTAVNVANTSYRLYDWFEDGVGDKSRENQDDHGLVARTSSREGRRMQHGGRTIGQRRTASTPPPLQPDRSLYWLMSKRIALASGWDIHIHKCPSDSRWHRLAKYLDWHGVWRYCMQGRCHELWNGDEAQYDLTFEGWLLHDEANVHMAKRYVANFCPERVDIVDETLARVTDRARLAIGPKMCKNAEM